MRKIKLGKTGLSVTKIGFGALPIQRRNMDDAIKILRKAYESGVNFYDTARGYSDSEEKIGNALGDVRSKIIIATKTHGKSPDEMKKHIEQSLKLLKTDYIDIYQFHNASMVHEADSLMYKQMLSFKEQGLIRHISVTAHKAKVAMDCIESGLFDTLQYPISCISDELDIEVVTKAETSGMGVIAMKAMAGGLVDKAILPFAFLEQFKSTVPIWGIQHMEELLEFVELDKNPPALDAEMQKRIDIYKKELSGDFCRGCGYCVKGCPADIQINMAARMTLLCGRAVWQNFVTEDAQAMMAKIDDCIDCGQCSMACPYDLNTPELLRKNQREYKVFLESHGIG